MRDHFNSDDVQTITTQYENPGLKSTLDFIKKKKGERTHGFQCPWSIPQMITLIVFSINVIALFLFDLPTLMLFSMPLAIGVTSVVGFLYGLIFWYAYKATISDPTDPTVSKERKTRISQY